MSELKRLEAKRSTFSSRISLTYKYATKALQEAEYISQFKIRYEDLENTFQNFYEIHNQIIMICTEDDEFTIQEKIRKDTESFYYECKIAFQKLFPPVNSGSSQIRFEASAKLPSISIPIYKGDQKLWPTFFDLYNKLIHENVNISSVEKLQYLFSYLEGEPQKLLAGISITNDNYQIAYDKLVSRYQNKRLLASNALNAILTSTLKNDSARELRSLLNTFSESLAALRALQFKTEQWDFVMFHILLEKLDISTRTNFEIEYSKTSIPTYEDMYQFLENKCKALESVQHLNKNKHYSTYSKQNNNFSKNIPKSNNSMLPFTSSCNNTSIKPPTVNVTCYLCNESHVLAKCQPFLNKTADERLSFAKQNKLCINCLHSSHSVQSCHSIYRCRTCRNKHHSLLHLSKSSLDPATNIPSIKVNTVNDQQGPSTSNNFQTGVDENQYSNQSTVLLATAIVDIKDGNGNYQSIRVLIDSGSQSNFLSEKCLRRLNLPRSNFSVSIYGLNQMSSVSSKGISHCIIKPQGKLNPIFSFDAIVVPKLCSDMPTFNLENKAWAHLEGLQLADQSYFLSSPIDLLLGAEVFTDILKNGKVMGKFGQPTAIETVFGWVLLGKVSNFNNTVDSNSFFSSITKVPLEIAIPKFWEVETLPTKTFYSPEEIKCEDIFQKTVTRDGDGRFIVSLPFKDGEPDLGDTYTQALRRFHLLELRLIKNPQLYSDYSNFMRDYLDTGHMSLITETDTPFSLSCYLPHHCVLKPDSISTKLRVVWDGSAKGSKRVSLNDTLLPGPKLQKDIASLLLTFRVYSYVFIADIKQMFRQILINPPHRNFQKILWRFSDKEPISEYRLNTVTFGLTSSPFLAMRTLNELADREKNRFPKASHLIKTQVYIDDILGISTSLSSALSLQKEVIDLLKLGGFELRKWASNSPEILSAVPHSDLQIPLSFDNEEPHFIKVLGLQWHPQNDFFSYKCSLSEKPFTKRSILSDIGRIFDPLGFLCPILLLAKYVMQCLWASNTDWDETPPDNIVQTWCTLKSELPTLSNFRLPRRIDFSNDYSCELHGFCDASQIGYAAVVYFRIQTQNYVSLSLVCAKSRVAPLKCLSLARLELLGAVLLTDLISFIKSTYSEHINISQTFAWTDSQIVLDWLNSPPSRWKTFVANRVSHIQDIVPRSSWFHVPSADNAADCASRGMMPSQLICHDNWWKGPSFLYLPHENWKSLKTTTFNQVSDVDLEERTNVMTTEISCHTLDLLLTRFSSLTRCQTVLSYCLRVSHNFKKLSKGVFGAPTPDELHNSLITLVKHVQHSVFSDLIIRIKKNRLLPKPFRKLALFLDSEECLRAGGRLRNSELSFSAKHPLLLPKSHRLTTLIIEYTHNKFLHPGLKTLHHLLLQNFWILSARKAIQKTLSQCLRCFRVRPKTYLPPVMGDLPYHRVSQLKPFSHVAMDFCGPFFVTPFRSRGLKPFKSYVCIFVCTSTKAIHIELTTELSTESFIAAFRRFVARRGNVTDCYSDNGTNFAGANNAFLQLSKIVCEKLEIRWHFSPPSGPHFNGLAESGVKMFKSHFLRVVGEQRLSLEEMSTLICQIESILNSRPLCAQSTDPNDLNPLTPGHFLTLEPLNSVIPSPDLSHLNINRLSRWQLIQKLHSDFWKRYSLEYLNTLQQRYKWSNSSTEVKLNTLVLIKSDTQPPLKWPLGRIVQLHPGEDGQVRVVTVKTGNGLFKRPVIKLCPLPNF